MKTDSFVLDNTLRYLVNSLMLHEGRLVAIEFTHRGKRWRTDTVEEAVALRERLETDDYEAAKADPKTHRSLLRAQSNWTADRVWDLLNGLGESQKQLLECLMKRDSTNNELLALFMELDSQVALAGVLSGLSKQVKALGLSPTELYRVDTSWDGKKRVRYFSLNSEFKVAAQDAGWPEAWKGVKNETATKQKRK